MHTTSYLKSLALAALGASAVSAQASNNASSTAMDSLQGFYTTNQPVTVTVTSCPNEECHKPVIVTTETICPVLYPTSVVTFTCHKEGSCTTYVPLKLLHTPPSFLSLLSTLVQSVPSKTLFITLSMKL